MCHSSLNNGAACGRRLPAANSMAAPTTSFRRRSRAPSCHARSVSTRSLPSEPRSNFSEADVADKSAYEGREQTLVKHIILRQYVSAWAHKVGTFCNALTYVDGFSGPWNAVSDDLSDASFSIALEELRKARETHAAAGRKIQLRCLFIEKDPDAYAKLKVFCDAVPDAVVESIHGEFEDHIADVIAFIKAGGTRSFPFVFIDPTGWSGFAMDTIAPLHQLNPIETLINFMTSHIRRFVESPQEETKDSFTD